ncbi:uncharacterized protein LOC110021796 isoform X2 [Phalaenopsis equestris]|uniref:uncharacterized protein LOC110021796 isoform X2 n=1 Tax=Phalaenopsis equestris TaxID=78828 RepID=UPI0009E29735|nr:uncharacterized protein LOC110021796 isoform X2 [Phalaenopsis equestris]
MEVGRRSSSSKNEFRESRSGRKKMGALPLAMFLSFNDKDVHPDCPNVSNPYHKCGRHCLVEIPRGKNFLDALRSDGDQEWEKKSGKMGVNPNCPHASNPYHKCAGYCLDKLSEKLQDAGKDQAATKLRGSKEGEKVLYAKTNTGFHPHCKHASNPNHECAESCFQSLTEGNIAQGEKHKEFSNKANKSSMRLNRNASNHNKVSETCFEDTPKKEHLMGDMKSKKKNEIDLTLQRELSSECRSASNPYHECGEYCIQHVPEREQHRPVIKLKSFQEGEKVMSKKDSDAEKRKAEIEIRETVEQIVNLEYKNASKPSHLCPEFCPEIVCERDRHEQVIRLRTTKEGCKNVLKPHHECTEFCFKSTPDRNIVEGENSKGGFMESDENVHTSPKHAPNPYNEFTEYYIEETSKKGQLERAIKPKEESEKVVFAEQGMNLDCRNVSNPDHARAAYCYQSVPKKERFRQTLMQSKENKAVFPLERVNPQCKYASNAYHVCAESCLQNVPNGHHPERSVMKSREEKKVVASTPVVDLYCEHLSNLYNVCAEHCSENFLERDPPQQSIKNLKEEDIVVLPSERRVSPECKFASNPYHVCAQYCLQNAIESEQHGQALMQSKENKEAVFPLERMNPQCKYASNAYHVCAESCLQNVPNGHHPERSVMKSREEKKVVTSTAVVDLDCKHLSNPYNVCAEHCSENFLERDPPQQTIKNLKEEDIAVLPSERRVSPECKFATNPYHVCAEYCLQNAIESEQHGQVMKLKSVKELKNLVSNKKIISGHPQCQYASNPYHQCAEYCFNKNIPGIKLPNGVMKKNERKKEKRNACRRDENPKYKDASNSFRRCAEYCPEEISPKNEAIEGSSAKVEKKKRNSSKENESREPTDVPPLRGDSTDLYHEWAKYCSQTKVADQDEIVKQAKKAGIGESTRRNGKGDCLQNYHGSANIEKVEATGDFSRSLFISLFFLVGFLLGLLRWSRVIYSLVMSSEKSEEPKRMRQGRHLDPKCEKVSDPFHKCSHYC